MLTNAQIDELRKKIVPILLPYGVQSVALFGSIVHGRESAGDVDILVKLKPPSERAALGFFTWVKIEEHLRQELGMPVDLVSEEGLSPYIRPYADEQKVVLYESEE